MGSQTKHFYAFGPFRLDAEKRVLVRAGTPITLPPKAAETLLLLVQRAGHLVEKDELMAVVWPDSFVEEGNLTKNVFFLRKTLGEWNGGRGYIETVPKRGYRFVAPVQEVTHAELAPSLPAIPSSELVGRKVSHYRVLEVIGGGGMGLVYKAEDLKLGRQVALKFLPEELASDEVALRRFEREAQTASSLNHPNICTIYEIEEHERQPFIVMELLKGQTLRERLTMAAGPLPLEQLLDLATQTCAGLQAAHSKGIVHRDIKPANIFLTESGQVKILDFGLAKLTDTEAQTPEELPSLSVRAEPQQGAPADLGLTRTGVALGTAGYMSPEQIRGENLDARSDLFPFGLVLYEMATGRKAFDGETASLVREAILHSFPAPAREVNPSLPASLTRVIDKALEKERERRYQSASELGTALETLKREMQLSYRTVGRWLMVATLVAAVVAGVWYYWRWRTAIKLSPNDTVVLADFNNTTGDMIFDKTLRRALQIYFRQTPFLSLLSGEKISRSLQELNRKPNAPLDYTTARDVCLQTVSRAVILGSIADSGNHYGIGLRAIECRTGKMMAQVNKQADDRNEVLRVVGLCGEKLRRELGEPASSLQAFNVPMERAATVSLDAMDAFVKSEAKVMVANEIALSDEQRTIQLDPNFALAYLALGANYENLGGPRDKMVAVYTRAFQLRDQTTPYIRYEIGHNYYEAVTGEIDKALAAVTEGAAVYPELRERSDFSDLYLTLGQYEKALDAALQAHRAGPADWHFFVNLAEAYVGLDQLASAKAILDQARAQGFDNADLRNDQFRVAFLRRDSGGMQEQLAWAAGKPGVEDVFLDLDASSQSYYGRVHKARALSQRAVELAKGSSTPEATSNWLVNHAIDETLIGDANLAHQNALEALALSNTKDRQIMAALIFAQAGDTKRAQAIAEELNRDFPLHTMVQNYALPSIRAAIALANNNPSAAVAVLEAARPYETANDTPPSLYPAYLRGLAYLKSNQPREAKAEFQKLIDHPGMIGINVYGALARLQLARAQAMMGDKPPARKSYQDFLTLWKDADPDIPIYQQAKAEYARLR